MTINGVLSTAHFTSMAAGVFLALFGVFLMSTDCDVATVDLARLRPRFRTGEALFVLGCVAYCISALTYVIFG